MNQKAIIMKSEIRSIAMFRALIISKRYITVILSITSLYLILMRSSTSSLYILLFLNLFPPIMIYLFRDYSSGNKNKAANIFTEDLPFLLNNAKTKYKYSKINYIANSAAYLISMIFLCIWQININNNFNEFINKLPILIIASGLTLRFLGVLFFRFKLSYDLMNNRV